MPSLQQLLNPDARYPIIQAPMAGVQDSRLALAVNEAGAIGSLPCAMLSPARLRSELEIIHAATDSPINHNFFCHEIPTPDPQKEAQWRKLLAPYYKEYGLDQSEISDGPARNPFSEAVMDVLADFKPKLISFHFGLPAKALLEVVKNWGSRVIASATTAEEASWLVEQGVDAVIAQGVEAGGHRGIFLSDDLDNQPPTHDLLKQILAVVDVPVIAAGGIATSAEVKECMDMGASGVQVGTSYLCCHEATTAPVHKKLLLDENGQDTQLTNLLTGRPARSIVNRLITELGPINASAPAFPLAANALAPLKRAALAKGSGDFHSLWSGKNTKGCREVSAREITLELAKGLAAA